MDIMDPYRAVCRTATRRHWKMWLNFKIFADFEKKLESLGIASVILASYAFNVKLV
jgi:hypothetical protein